jgi:hypothetical protein
MKRFLTTLASVLGLWILASFAGVVADGARPEFWTTSLMWSLLAGLVIAPFYAFVNSAMFESYDVSNDQTDESSTDEPAPAFDAGSREAPPTRALDLDKINEMASARKLWPEDSEETVSA